MIRVALIGYGYAGKTFHAPLISATPGLDLKLIASSGADKVLRDWPRAEVESDPYRAINRDDIDLVVIATPNNTHASLAEAALNAGKHVVVDKPFTLTAAEAHALRRSSMERNRIISVFHNRRWDSDYITLKAILAQGALGEILTVESRFDRFRPEVRQRWREQDLPGSGLWFDLGPHLVDQALRLFGEPRAIHGRLATQRPGAETCDWFNVHFDYGRLQVVLAASMLVAAPLPRFAVHGTQGSWLKYGLDPQEDQLKNGMQPGDPGWGQDIKPGTLYAGDGEQTTMESLNGDYRAYYRGIADAVAAGKAVPVPVEQACRVMDVIEAVANDASS